MTKNLFNKYNRKFALKVIIKMMVIIVVVTLIESAFAGITNADIKNASKTWVSTISDWTPGVVGGGMVLAAIMFFLNKYAYALGAIGGTAFMYAAKSFMGTGEAALTSMAKILFG